MRRLSKAFIRKQYISIRDSLSPLERRQKSHLICKRLFELEEFKVADICLVYASFRSEVETDLIITKVLECGKRLALPIIDAKNRELFLCEIKNGPADLVESTYGIREPRLDKKGLILPEKIDLFIIPGVVFDTNGIRLGYGGGYYDRLLSKIHKKQIIGLAFEIQISTNLPSESYDKRMHKILTEDRVIDCKSLLINSYRME